MTLELVLLVTDLADLADTVVQAADQAPEPEDVTAGWAAFAIFIGLIVALALLGWSLSKRLRGAQRSADEGRYDPSDPKRDRDSTD